MANYDNDTYGYNKEKVQRALDVILDKQRSILDGHGSAGLVSLFNEFISEEAKYIYNPKMKDVFENFKNKMGKYLYEISDVITELREALYEVACEYAVEMESDKPRYEEFRLFNDGSYMIINSINEATPDGDTLIYKGFALRSLSILKTIQSRLENLLDEIINSVENCGLVNESQINYAINGVKVFSSDAKYKFSDRKQEIETAIEEICSKLNTIGLKHMQIYTNKIS